MAMRVLEVSFEETAMQAECESMAPEMGKFAFRHLTEIRRCRIQIPAAFVPRSLAIRPSMAAPISEQILAGDEIETDHLRVPASETISTLVATAIKVGRMCEQA